MRVAPSPGSIRGVQYVAATGARIKNLGQQLIPFWTADGVGVSWMFQVAAVNKPLASVAKLVGEVWRVTFDLEVSCLTHRKTGRVIKLRRDRGVYVVDAYMVSDPRTSEDIKNNLLSLGQAASVPSNQVFSRQGV